MKNRGLAFLMLSFFISASVFVLSSDQQKADLGKNIQSLSEFEKKFIIEFINPLKDNLKNFPLILNVPEILKAVPDFNPANYVLVSGNPKKDWQVLPSQIDDLDGDKKPDELVFITSLAPGTTEISCYYSPKGARTVEYPVKAHARLAWETQNANIGWESNCASYRLYYGQIEGFGKLHEYLILPGLTANYAYHNMQEWGMDILHVGNASGLGGISLWEGEVRIPAMNLGGKGDIKIERRVLASGPVRGLGRVDLSNIRSEKGEFTLILFVSAYADNFFSRQDIYINTPGGNEIIYSPGLQKLAGENWTFDKDKGFLATWGLGAEGAGEIGLGLMFEPGEYAGFSEDDLDRFVKLRAASGKKQTHWILTGWSNGFTTPASPAASNWAKRLEELGNKLRTPLPWKVKH
jgi:hypothetical protein